MNMLQMAPFTPDAGSTRVNRQSETYRIQASRPVQERKEGFSRIFEGACRTESSTRDLAKANNRDSANRSSTKVLSKSDADTQTQGTAEGRNDSAADGKVDAKDHAKTEDASKTDKSVKEKSAADQPVTERSAGEKSTEDTPVTGSPASQTNGNAEPSLKLELLSQLAEMLQILGMTLPNEGNAVTNNGTSDGGQEGLSQAAAALNLNQLKLDQNQLRQILNQLIDTLNKQGSVPNDLSELKMLAETRPGSANQVSVTDFLGRLLDAAKQAAQSLAQPANQAETAASVPMVTVVAKSVQQAEHSGRINSEKAGTASDAVPKDSKVVTGNSLGSAQNPLNQSSDGDFRQNTDANGKDDKIVVPGLKSANGNSQSGSIPHSGERTTALAEFSIHPEVQTNGQVPGQASQTGAEPMPRMTQLIFSQIAQKARLVVAPGTTEMQIQLKPDFLGKLNLNISSDNGMVTAKFTAESHAVKGIIEANLNTLKDALAQQGVKVDQLVVDVGTQNHQSNFENRQGFYGNGNSRRPQVPVSSQEIENLFSNEAQSGLIKDYYGSTVEYTA